MRTTLARFAGTWFYPTNRYSRLLYLVMEDIKFVEIISCLNVIDTALIKRIKLAWKCTHRWCWRLLYTRKDWIVGIPYVHPQIGISLEVKQIAIDDDGSKLKLCNDLGHPISMDTEWVYKATHPCIKTYIPFGLQKWFDSKGTCWSEHWWLPKGSIVSIITFSQASPDSI